MSGRLHDRSCFYKYASRSTALRVIEGKSFLWSSPTKFNDPFDHQIGFVIELDKDKFADLLTAAAERLIFVDELPSGFSPSSAFAVAALHLRKFRNQLSRKQIVQVLRETINMAAQTLHEDIASFSETLQEHLCHSRVFCVSATHDNVVMWSHYSEEHQGVVFKLKCDDALDNMLLAAKEVNYTDGFIPFPSAEVYARHLTGEEPFDFTPLVWQMAYTKHRDWRYEREWRVHIPLLSEPAGDGYSIFKEDPSIFEEIYLGCRMPPEDATAIINAVRAHLPDTRIFQAVRSTMSFSLDFKEIS